MKGKAIILASGSGRRLGNNIIPKHLTKLDGVETLIWLLNNIIISNLFDQIYIICRNSDMQITEKVVLKYHSNQSNLEIKFVQGGDKRIDSIYSGINNIISSKNPEKKLVIGFFDANRPFIQKNQIKNLFELTLKYSCACPIRGIVNGIAEIDNQRLINVPSKDKFVEFFTPEFVTLDCLVKDYDNLYNFNSIVEYCIDLGIKPRYSEASIFNCKLTYPEDISFFENIINNNNISKPKKLV